MYNSNFYSLVLFNNKIQGKLNLSKQPRCKIDQNNSCNPGVCSAFNSKITVNIVWTTLVLFVVCTMKRITKILQTNIEILFKKFCFRSNGITLNSLLTFNLNIIMKTDKIHLFVDYLWMWHFFC
jgi:hypothetical protein